MSLAHSFLALPLLYVVTCGQDLPARSAVADQWLVRAKSSYKSGNFDDAVPVNAMSSPVPPMRAEVE